MSQKVVYAVIFIITLYTGAIYVDSELRFLIAFELLLPLCSVGWILYSFRRFRVEMEEQKLTCLRKEALITGVRLVNESFFPVTASELLLEWEECGNGKVCKRKKICGLLRGGESVLEELTLETGHCGMYFLNLRKIRLYDGMRIFSLGRKSTQQLQVVVLPAIHDFSGEIKEALLHAFLEEKYDREGENPDQYQIREYQPGDSMHKVHWKLSAKSGELRIREFERKSERISELLLELCVQEKDEEAECRWDAFLETAVSILAFLCTSGFTIRVSWYDVLEQSHSCLVRREEDIRGCMLPILGMDKKELRSQPFSAGEETEGRLVLSMDRSLYRDGELLLSVAEEYRTNDGSD